MPRNLMTLYFLRRIQMRYCPACGKDVNTYSSLNFDSDSPGEAECCIHCGMVIEDSDEVREPHVETVLMAEDSIMMREVLQDVLIEKRIAEKVIPCNDGAEFITAFTNMLIEKKGASLVVLDVSMPKLNGINAAVALRSIEKSFVVNHVPILFFTAHICDDTFKKVLAYCKPAYYLNKGAKSNPGNASISSMSKKLPIQGKITAIINSPACLRSINTARR